MASYVRQKSAFTSAGGNISPAALVEEIYAALGVRPQTVNIDSAVEIIFASTINTTTLDTVVAAHGGADEPLTTDIVEETTVDKSTTSTVFVDLISRTFTCRASTLAFIASYSMANTNNAAQTFFQILIDGVPRRGSKQCASNVGSGNSGSIACKMALSRGSHTVKLQWKVDKGTGMIRPATRDDEHACIQIREIR